VPGSAVADPKPTLTSAKTAAVGGGVKVGGKPVSAGPRGASLVVVGTISIVGTKVGNSSSIVDESPPQAVKKIIKNNHPYFCIRASLANKIFCLVCLIIHLVANFLDTKRIFVLQ
jgi:hypothetical protein